MRLSDRGVSVALGAATALQGVLLVPMGHLQGRVAFQTILVAGALGLAVQQAWRHRRQLDHHVDMGLVMLAFGGLGMLVGFWIDLAALPAGHTGRVYATVWHAVFSWMTGLMLLAAIPPAIPLTRCAALARTSRARWFITHILGNAAMIAGMIAGGRLLGAAAGTLLGAPVVGHHLAMVVGMVIGMELGMVAGEAVAGLKPWVRLEVPLPGEGAAAVPGETGSAGARRAFRS
jgi:hypothetical protein